MLATVEYSSYTNMIVGMGFLSANSKHLKESLLIEVKFESLLFNFDS